MQNYVKIICDAEKIKGEKIDLNFPSVGATENAILASVLAEGTTTITNSAREPEIIDLQNFLNKMGAKIIGAGTNEIQITGVKKLKDIETGTFLCLAVATKGNLILENTNAENITPVITKLQEAECKIEIEKNKIKINSNKKIKALDIKTMPYPGFPTDMQSVFSAMLTTAKGTSIIVENIFENRFKYTQELNKMGAKITVEGKSAIIRGVRKIYGANVKATDLRGGAALVLAGLSAKGITKVENIDYILRGYERFDKKLEKLSELRRKESNGGLSENEKRELMSFEPDDEVKYIILIEELLKNADEFKLGLGIEPDSIQPYIYTGCYWKNITRPASIVPSVGIT